MKSKGEILGIALLLSIGALLLGCTIRPPHSLVALCGHAWRIVAESWVSFFCSQAF